MLLRVMLKKVFHLKLENKTNVYKKTVHCKGLKLKGGRLTKTKNCSLLMF